MDTFGHKPVVDDGAFRRKNEIIYFGSLCIIAPNETGAFFFPFYVFYIYNMYSLFAKYVDG